MISELKRYLNKNNMRQEDLADQLGICAASLSNILNQNTGISDKLSKRINDILANDKWRGKTVTSIKDTKAEIVEIRNGHVWFMAPRGYTRALPENVFWETFPHAARG